MTSGSEDAELITDESDMFPLRKMGYLVATWLAIFASAGAVWRVACVVWHVTRYVACDT